jgi:hypothetical protein
VLLTSEAVVDRFDLAGSVDLSEIVGAQAVDSLGKLIGDFMPSPNDVPSPLALMEAESDDPFLQAIGACFRNQFGNGRFPQYFGGFEFLSYSRVLTT